MHECGRVGGPWGCVHTAHLMRSRECPSSSSKLLVLSLTSLLFMLVTVLVKVLVLVLVEDLLGLHLV